MMMPYHNSPSSDEDEETAIPLIPTILPSTRTTMTTTSMSYRSTKVRMIAIFAGVMLLLVVAGGASSTHDVIPRRVPNKHSKKTTKPPVINSPATNSPATKPPTKGFVVTLGSGNNPCVAASKVEKFKGVSITTISWGYSDAFETCYQWKSDKKYCWSKTIYNINNFYECRPFPYSGDDDGWQHVDPKDVLDDDTKYKSCGPPCQTMTGMDPIGYI